MDDDRTQRRSDAAERANYHVEAQRRQAERESAKAQVLIDRFVEEATGAGLATEVLTARPWKGGHRYRTDVVGWYLRGDQSVGVGTDGRYYELLVPPERFGRWRTVHLDPQPAPLQVGRGGRDGESVALDVLLTMRLQWKGSAGA